METHRAAPVSRRRFFVNALLGASGLLSLGVLTERMLEYFMPPAPPQRKVELAAIRLAEIPEGAGTVVHLPAGHVALERHGDNVIAHSAVCTHLGCIVRWNPEGARAWLCPCHLGSYGHDGHVLGGPPPRPLVPVPATVRDGMVYVTVTVRAASPVA